jgi:hypothetical protein
MAAGDQYWAKALELLAHAEIEKNSAMRRDLEIMAAAYLRLAHQAERNAKLVEFEEMTPKEI